MTYRNRIIGKHIEVIYCTNPCDLHTKGSVVDETRNMMQVTKNGELKWLIKKNVIVLLEGHEIDGKELVGRPENRMKR